MKLPRRQILQLAAGAVALPAVSRFAWAQAYPSRPITMVVPFAAGGPTDTIARIMAERMRASLGQTVIIENVDRRGGHDRRRPRRARGARRLHARHRPLEHARGQRRDLSRCPTTC